MDHQIMHNIFYLIKIWIPRKNLEIQNICIWIMNFVLRIEITHFIEYFRSFDDMISKVFLALHWSSFRFTIKLLAQNFEFLLLILDIFFNFFSLSEIYMLDAFMKVIVDLLVQCYLKLMDFIYGRKRMISEFLLSFGHIFGIIFKF